MTRILGIALAGLIAFLALLAEIENLREQVEAQIEQQRHFNAHQ